MSTPTESRAAPAGPAFTGPAPCRTLAEYVAELVTRLDAADPGAGRRLRDLTRGRRARITLDEETVDVAFTRGRLVVSAPEPGREPHGWGATDRATTLELLAGRLEVTAALLDGRIEVRGEMEDVMRIFHAIEILLDAAARAPALQRLARDYEEDPCRRSGSRAFAATAFAPAESPDAEVGLLRRLDLLP